MMEGHTPGKEVRPGVFTTNDPKFDWDHNLKRMVNSGTGRPIPVDVQAFTMLEHDQDAAKVIENYLVVQTAKPDLDIDHVVAVAKCLKEFKDFASANPARMKQAHTFPRLPISD